MNVSRSGYYEWSRRPEKNSLFSEEDQKILEEIFRICRAVSYVPGARIMKYCLERKYHRRIGRKRITRLMKSANLRYGGRGWSRKDPYKGDATHLHPGCALQNHVFRDFFKGPRRVILTDITYLYFDLYRQTGYLCTFFDSFTGEFLGWAVKDRMDCSLIREAYGMMMETHRQEFRFAEKVYIHSDQGSQFLQTEWQQILKDDGFIQSMSRRGNSQDNAPQESVFGRLKDAAGGHILRCKELSQVRSMISTYVQNHNEMIPQTVLAGLAPKEYFQYCRTGIYPVSKPFGVDAEELHEIQEIINERRKKARSERERRKRRDLKPEPVPARNVLGQIEMDLSMIVNKLTWLDREIEKLFLWQDEVNGIYERALRAKEWILKKAPHVANMGNDNTVWSLYPQLNYFDDFSVILR